MALKPLDKIASPNLVGSSTQDWKDDIITKIQLDPNWNTIYDGDLFQNAFQMIMEMGVFLAKKNAKSANHQLKEKFLNQAFSPQAINDNLMDMRVDLQQCTGSEVELQAIIENDLLNETIVIPKFQTVYGTNPNGERVSFELIKKDNDGKFNYFDNIVVAPTVEFRDYFKVMAYAGTTFAYEYEITPEMKENFVINIPDTDIIDNSIRIFFITAAGARVELPFTDSFVVEPVYIEPYFPESTSSGAPHWTVKYNYDGSAKILFGNESFGGAFEDEHIGKYIRVFGRSGGGERTNVNSGMINYKLAINISGGRILTATLTNANDATGGADREDLFRAQIFAPYRFGRDKTIIDATDAQTALYSRVIKHELLSPLYTDDPTFENVPILHAFHRIVPIRNFANFEFPDVETSDTADTYNVKFLAALQTFCNVVGAHGEVVEGEEVTDFVYPDINGMTYVSYIPENKYPLSGSLRAYAYDINGRIVDSVVFNSNYVTDQKNQGYSSSSALTEHATVTSNEFSTILVVNNAYGRNDKLVFSIDYDVFPYIFTIIMTTGIKTYKEYAEELQAAIVADIAANAGTIFGSYVNYQFVTYTANSSNAALGTITINSPLTGSSSKITIRDNGTLDTVTDPQYNIYLFLGFEKKNYRPANETGLVFDSGNTYKYNDNILTLNFKQDYEVTETRLHDNLGIVVNHASVTGPSINIILTDEDGYLYRLFETFDMTVEAYDSGDNLLETLTFPSISALQDTNGSIDNVTPIIFNGTSVSKYDYDAAKITINFLNNVTTPVYTSNYPTIYRVDIVRLIETSPGVYEEDEEFTPIEFLETSGNYTYDITSSTGAVVTLTMTSDQNNTIAIGDNIVVKFIHRDALGLLSVVESAKILNIEDSLINNTFEIPETIQSVVDMTYMNGGNPGNRYERANRAIVFKFIDGTLDSGTTYYVKGYTTFAYLKIHYHKKTYENVVIDYEPNPYYPEGEAASLISVLNNTSKRLIGLENIIKKVTFEPRPITVNLTVKRGYGVAEAVDAAKQQLTLDFDYSNQNHEHTIGSLMTQQIIKNSIAKIAATYGIIDITINNNEDTDSPFTTVTQYKYKFVSEELYEQLRLLENSKTQLSGLSDKYKILVSAVSEELKA